MVVSVSNVDSERVRHLTNKIYREMLCITRRGTMSYIIMGGLDHVRVSAVSWTPQYGTVLSWDLLDWILSAGDMGVKDSIPYFFSNFITTPQLSVHCSQFQLAITFGELFSFCIEHLFNRYLS